MAYKKEYSKVGKKYTTENKPAYKPKRGLLSKLMSEDEKASAGIHELSYDFGCRITRLFQYLTEDSEYKEYVISKQIYRSGTSIGANVRESKHAQSDADFLSKMSIAYKEADETDFAEVARFRICPREQKYGIQIPKGVWHGIVVHELSTIFEAKDGAYGK